MTPEERAQAIMLNNEWHLPYATEFRRLEQLNALRDLIADAIRAAQKETREAFRPLMQAAEKHLDATACSGNYQTETWIELQDTLSKAIRGSDATE